MTNTTLVMALTNVVSA